ncbi:MAG: IS1380 family transposase, partial [Phocaeicola sp.]
MNTKIALKSDSITPFGGVFYVLDKFSHLGLDSLIDSTLGDRTKYYGYQYSEILRSLLCIYYCGGDCIEDIGSHLGHHLELRPNTQIPSPDTIL